MEKPQDTAWHHLPADEVVQLLRVGLSTGLSAAEVQRLLLTLVQAGRFDPTPLITHRFSLDEITQGYQLFGERLDGVLKVTIKP